MTEADAPNGRLRWLLNPLDESSFLVDSWEKRPVVISRGGVRYYEDVLSLSEIDRTIGSGFLVFPAIRMIRDGKPIPVAEYTNPAQTGEKYADPDSVFDLFQRGATININHLQRNLVGLASLCADLEEELTCTSQVNIYLTPPNAQGFSAHYDTHDVFVLQIAGRKVWRLYDDPPVELPGRDQACVREKGPPPHDVLIEERELGPGDLVYIPRGFVHEARTSAELSLHVTLGITSYTAGDIFSRAVARLVREDVRFRRSLPVGFGADPDAFAEAQGILSSLLAGFPALLPVGATLEKTVEDFYGLQRSQIGGRIEELALLDGIGDETILERRPGLRLHVDHRDESVRLLFAGKKIDVPEVASRLVDRIAETLRFRVGDLPHDVGAAGNISILRTFIREGLLQRGRGEGGALPTGR